MLYLMELILLISLPSILCVQMIISGYSFNKFFFKENFDYKQKNIYLIFSFIFFSNIFLILNFFFSLNIYLNTLIFLLPLVFIYKIKSKDIKKIILFSFKFTIFFILLVSFDNINRPDAGLYHYPYMNILNSEKIIFGSANLHFRFAHTSIIQYLAAGYKNLIFFDKGLIIIPAIIYFSIVSFFYKEIKNQQNNNLLLFVSYFFLFQILYDMNRYSGYGNDVPAHILFLVCIYYFIKLDPNSYKSFFLIGLLSILTFQNKSTLILVLILPLLFIFINKNFKFLLEKKNLILIFFLSCWFIKNIVISGCLLFPKEITCSKKVFWSSSLVTNMNSADKVSLENEARSKDHPNRINREINYQDYLKTNWRPTWLKGHGKSMMIKKTFPILFILICLVVFLRINKNPKKQLISYKSDKIRINQIFILSLTGTIIWFENFPTYRYGAAYIITFIVFSFAILPIISKSNLKKYLKPKFINIIILVLISKFLLKYDLSQNLWPNIYDYNSKNLTSPQVKKIFIKDKFAYYKTINGGVCMSNFAPCSHFDLHNRLSLKIINGYKFFYLDL